MKEFKRVDKRARIKWFLSRLIGTLLLLCICLPVMLFSRSMFGSAIPFFFAAAIMLLQLCNMLIYPFFEYIQWSYYIGADCIEIKKGVFWRSHIVIPISRIQHVCSKRGPVQRLFGLATVEIHTAGGQHSIDELSKEVAEEICELLQNVVNKKVAAQIAAGMPVGGAVYVAPNISATHSSEVSKDA